LHPANIHGILLCMYKRLILSRLPSDSFFLFGPRQVGKTTLLRQLESVFYVDLLNRDSQLEYTKDPQKLYRQVNALGVQSGRIIIDEIQKVPALLDVTQQIMDQFRGFQLILSGSSARKLKRDGANLLGGRALERSLHPLTIEELASDFDLSTVIQFGSLPHISRCVKQGNQENVNELLRAYVTTYLTEEIKAEALVRNLQGFQNFLEVASFQFSEPVNFSEISKEANVSYSTVREYYSVLEDTLIGFFLPSYLPSVRKRMSKSPKFYFFDNGVTRAISGTLRAAVGKREAGHFFEQWWIQEVRRINEYEQKDWKLFFWRTSHGAEVDLILTLGKRILCAIEVKHKRRITSSDLSGLLAFKKDFPNVPCFIVAPISQREKLNGINIYPPSDLINELRKKF
jgi:uncharacterized protein